MEAFMKKDWIDYFFNICDTVAAKSKDTTKVGAVLVGDEKQILGTGFNGCPIGTNSDPVEHPERYDKKEDKYLVTAHAEENLIAFAARHGVPTNNATLFCNLTPCINCTRMIITSGIKAVYFKQANGSGDWRKHLTLARQLFVEAKVELHVFNCADELNDLNEIHFIYYKDKLIRLYIHYGYTVLELGDIGSPDTNLEFYEDSCDDMVATALDYAKDMIDSDIKCEKSGNEEYDPFKHKTNELPVISEVVLADMGELAFKLPDGQAVVKSNMVCRFCDKVDTLIEDPHDSTQLVCDNCHRVNYKITVWI